MPYKQSILTGLALLMGITGALANPFDQTHSIVKRQAILPPNCTIYRNADCGVAKCIIRPTNCLNTYMVHGGDDITGITTNSSIVGNVTATALYAWNPDIGQSAQGLQACIPICTNVAGYVFSGQPAAGSILPASANPAPIMSGIVAGCTTFEFVGYVGNSVFVNQILAGNGITDAQFRTWNTGAIANDGTIQIWAGYYVCVAA